MNISVLNILQASNDHELLGQQEHDFETERKCALGSEQAIAANGSPQETPPEYPTPIDIPEPTEIPDPVPHQDPVEIRLEFGQWITFEDHSVFPLRPTSQMGNATLHLKHFHGVYPVTIRIRTASGAVGQIVIDDVIG